MTRREQILRAMQAHVRAHAATIQRTEEASGIFDKATGQAWRRRWPGATCPRTDDGRSDAFLEAQAELVADLSPADVRLWWDALPPGGRKLGEDASDAEGDDDEALRDRLMHALTHFALAENTRNSDLDGAR
jgi:hypothetical protein